MSNTATLTVEGARECALSARNSIERVRCLRKASVRRRWSSLTWWQRVNQRFDEPTELMVAANAYWSTYRVCEQILEAIINDGVLFYTIDLAVLEDMNEAHREELALLREEKK